MKQKKERHIVIGAGEVGRGLYRVLRAKYAVAIRDKDNAVEGTFDVMHVAYPPMPRFVEVTKAYAQQYRPKLMIIHSTVAPGTTRKIGLHAVHSPIRGMHPRLDRGIKTFVKYFGGKDAKKAARIFAAAGVPVRMFAKPETTELLKVLDTTYYGWNIVFAKEAQKICKAMGLDFDEVYTIPNHDYNEGYRKLGLPQVRRPVLKAVPGKIGGHCVIQNCDLLDAWVTKTLKERNKTF